MGLRRVQLRGSRLLQALCAAADVDAKATRAAELRKAQRQALLTALTAWPVDVTGHEGYMKVSWHVPPFMGAPSSGSAEPSPGCGLCSWLLSDVQL